MYVVARSESGAEIEATKFAGFPGLAQTKLTRLAESCSSLCEGRRSLGDGATLNLR